MSTINLPYVPHPDLKILRRCLSKREAECLYFLLRGNTAKNIANILRLSPRTVEHYLENVKMKFNVRTKTELIEKTIDHFTNAP